MFKRISTVIMAFAILTLNGFGNSAGMKVFAETKQVEATTSNNKSITVEPTDNTTYYFSAAEYNSAGSVSYVNNNKTAVLFEKNKGTATYVINNPKKAGFILEVKYSSVANNSKDIEFSLKINDEIPFEDADELVLKRFWRDSDDGVKQDALGNEYAPTQVVFEDYVKSIICNESDADCREFIFELQQGVNYITFSNFSDDVAIESFVFKTPTVNDTYKDYISNNKLVDTKGEYKIYEAENAYLKSTRSLVPKADPSSALITPNDPITQKINYIGGTGWTTPGEEIIWNIDIPSDGYYKIGYCYKQDQKINSISYRTLKIDGVIPFEECESLPFEYGVNWQNIILGEEDEEYLFYFKKGNHTLSMTATLGVTVDYYSELKDILSEIGDLYVEITMITGESPDNNRDYELFNAIPNFNDRLDEIRKELSKIAEGMKELTEDKSNSFITSIKDMERILTSMIEYKYDAQKYIKNYSTSYSTLCNSLYEMRTTPLSLDKIYIVPNDCDFEFETVGLFTKLSFGIKRFLMAFSSDYGNFSVKTDDEKQLKIWVNWGRDQATVLNSLISESFTPKTGISVNLEVTNASMIYGMLSGIAPDLSLHMARTEPVNLALRGALVDLSKFEDYDEVIKRFGESASTPYKYGDGVYALPDQQSFYIMFYRKDILQNLGISVPETWDEFLEAVAILQLNNMDAWIPYTQISSATTVNTGVGGLNMYASILQQHGGNFFNKDLNECIINDEIGLKAFNFWTDMYTKHKLPNTASFYNRFRIGTMPLGIDGYTLYTTIATAAPDIDGRWGIALVPGIKDENGKINRTVSGSGTGCAILKTSKLPNEAWEFLKWWTDAETQLMYNNNVESVLGTISRTTTANIEAFSNMDWDKDDLPILLEQRDWIEEIPEVPGSYYVSRSVDQAFWNVINNNGRVKDILDKQTKIATMEIERKISEYANKQ